jgi:hypothetical protein
MRAAARREKLEPERERALFGDASRCNDGAMRSKATALTMVAALLTGLSGCASSSGTVFEKHPYPATPLKAKLVHVSVHDARETKVEGTFDTPVISTPGDSEERSVQLLPSTVEEMKRRLSRYVRGGGREVVVDIVLKSGTAGWKASWTAETAFTKVSLELTFRDAASGRAVASTFGEAWGEVRSMDVADGEPSELFQAAVLAAFDRAVTQSMLREILSRSPSSELVD